MASLQVFERVLIELAELHVGVVEAAFEEEIRKGLHQVFGAEAEVLAGIARIAIPISLVIPALRPSRFGSSERVAAAFALGGESRLFVPADPPVRVEAFEDELGRGGPHRIRLARAKPQLLGLFEQTLNAAQAA